MLEHARRRGLTVKEGSATELPYPDASFDVAVSFKVLAHVPDIERALSEMARVVRPGGHIIAELYNPWSVRYLAKKLAGPQPISDGRTEADVYTRWDSPTRAKALLPPTVEFVDFAGVRVFTPAAFVHKIPFVGGLFAQAERFATKSPLRVFGGFLVAIAKKR
jgi:ubiquinone/menaquinone biosynthesis C-methylase UbiE